MEIHFGPEVEAQLDRLAAQSGRAKEEFVHDAMAGYFEELTQVRETLDRRYDEIKSGKVKLIPAEEAYASLMDGIEARRSKG